MALQQPMPPFVPQVPSPNAVVIRSIYAEDYDPNDPILPVAKVVAAPKVEVVVKLVPKVALPKVAPKPKKVVAATKKKVSSKKPSRNGKPAKKVVANKPANNAIAKKPSKNARRRACAA